MIFHPSITKAPKGTLHTVHGLSREELDAVREYVSEIIEDLTDELSTLHTDNSPNFSILHAELLLTQSILEKFNSAE